MARFLALIALKGHPELDGKDGLYEAFTSEGNEIVSGYSFQLPDDLCFEDVHLYAWGHFFGDGWNQHQTMHKIYKVDDEQDAKEEAAHE